MNVQYCLKKGQGFMMDSLMPAWKALVGHAPSELQCDGLLNNGRTASTGRGDLWIHGRGMNKQGDTLRASAWVDTRVRERVIRTPAREENGRAKRERDGNEPVITS
mmetsp:Transcript_5922/g.12486  ORF Transcript_5922/g.12486 Transcript_5922/m.12486 type:complete len:106 (+) Transcript_5922:1598-1915(+)